MAGFDGPRSVDCLARGKMSKSVGRDGDSIEDVIWRMLRNDSKVNRARYTLHGIVTTFRKRIGCRFKKSVRNRIPKDEQNVSDNNLCRLKLVVASMLRSVRLRLIGLQLRNVRVYEQMFLEYKDGMINVINKLQKVNRWFHPPKENNDAQRNNVPEDLETLKSNVADVLRAINDFVINSSLSSLTYTVRMSKIVSVKHVVELIAFMKTVKVSMALRRNNRANTDRAVRLARDDYDFESLQDTSPQRQGVILRDGPTEETQLQLAPQQVRRVDTQSHGPAEPVPSITTTAGVKIVLDEPDDVIKTGNKTRQELVDAYKDITNTYMNIFRNWETSDLEDDDRAQMLFIEMKKFVNQKFEYAVKDILEEYIKYHLKNNSESVKYVQNCKENIIKKFTLQALQLEHINAVGVDFMQAEDHNKEIVREGVVRFVNKIPTIDIGKLYVFNVRGDGECFFHSVFSALHSAAIMGWELSDRHTLYSLRSALIIDAVCTVPTDNFVDFRELKGENYITKYRSKVVDAVKEVGNITDENAIWSHLLQDKNYLNSFLRFHKFLRLFTFKLFYALTNKVEQLYDQLNLKTPTSQDFCFAMVALFPWLEFVISFDNTGDDHGSNIVRDVQVIDYDVFSDMYGGAVGEFKDREIKSFRRRQRVMLYKDLSHFYAVLCATPDTAIYDPR